MMPHTFVMCEVTDVQFSSPGLGGIEKVVSD